MCSVLGEGLTVEAEVTTVESLFAHDEEGENYKYCWNVNIYWEIKTLE